MENQIIIEPYFRFYQGENANPFQDTTDVEMDKSRFWNLEQQWATIKDNKAYIEGALTLYSNSGLDEFCADDGVPMEFKAYLLRRMVKSQRYIFTIDDFKKRYLKYCYFNRERFKYYKGENANPFPKNSTEGKFWYGEMNFVTTHQSFNDWISQCEHNISQLEELCDDESLNHLKAYSKTQQAILMYFKQFFGNKGVLSCDNWIWKY